MKYTLPFTPDNCDALYSKRNGSCNLVLKDESRDRPPYSIATVLAAGLTVLPSTVQEAQANPCSNNLEADRAAPVTELVNSATRNVP